MKTEQISVFVENRAGRLCEIIHLLARAQINIRALSLADNSDFGLLRMIACPQDKATAILKEAGLTMGRADVVAVEIPDQAGALYAILELLSRNGINVEYMYACARRSQNRAIMIFRLDKIDEAIPILIDNGHPVIPGDELCEI